MNELSCRTVSDLVAARACRGPIIAPTVPRVASFTNSRRDVEFDGADLVMLFSPWRRVVEQPRHRSQIRCISLNCRPANWCVDYRRLPLSSPKNSSQIVKLLLVGCQGTEVICEPCPRPGTEARHAHRYQASVGRSTALLPL